MEKKKSTETPKIDTMGGQAVVEGVLMRSPYGYAIAVRHPHDKEIIVESRKYTPVTKRIKLLGVPFLRGVVTLFEMLIIGLKSFNFSIKEWEESMTTLEEKEHAEAHAEKIDETNLTEKERKKAAKKQKKFEKAQKKRKEKKGGSASMAMAMVLGMALAIFLIVILPNFLTSLTGRVLPAPPAAEQAATPQPGMETVPEYTPSEKSALVEEQRPFLYNLVAGFFRGAILLGYLIFVSLFEDARRIFQYHGAEHKTVYAYEKEGDANVETAKKYSTLHPRCGTAFIAVVILISIIIFALIAQVVAWLFPGFTTLPFLAKKGILIGLHILFLPLVAGSAYEIIKVSSRYYAKCWVCRLLVFPGILFQKITTKEPDEDQIEVAIASLKAALSLSDTDKSQSVERSVTQK